MAEGYNYLATLPSGACDVAVAEKSTTENNLALRWTDKNDKNYYFNGDWMVQQSGNYSAGGNLFTYEHPEDARDAASVERIKFASQLTRRIDVFLIVKAKNPGVKFSYVLPPRRIAHADPAESDKEGREQMTEELKRNGSAAVVDAAAEGREPREDEEETTTTTTTSNKLTKSGKAHVQFGR